MPDVKKTDSSLHTEGPWRGVSGILLMVLSIAIAVFFSAGAGHLIPVYILLTYFGFGKHDFRTRLKVLLAGLAMTAGMKFDPIESPAVDYPSIRTQLQSVIVPHFFSAILLLPLRVLLRIDLQSPNVAAFRTFWLTIPITITLLTYWTYYPHLTGFYRDIVYYSFTMPALCTLGFLTVYSKKRSDKGMAAFAGGLVLLLACSTQLGLQKVSDYLLYFVIAGLNLLALHYFAGIFVGSTAPERPDDVDVTNVD